MNDIDEVPLSENAQTPIPELTKQEEVTHDSQATWLSGIKSSFSCCGSRTRRLSERTEQEQRAGQASNDPNLSIGPPGQSIAGSTDVRRSVGDEDLGPTGISPPASAVRELHVVQDFGDIVSDLSNRTDDVIARSNGRTTPLEGRSRRLDGFWHSIGGEKCGSSSTAFGVGERVDPMRTEPLGVKYGGLN
ncbi:hypothetical protein M231_07150 [Tremella mesenterica]|uniref:Uncharacterized protein n=1 Tax=Tremella mesenterica TaxID=5217 RepID=A0A4Q1BCR4_TREME|nr:hypothetical protein M231_07150 [Tremella mesenterica]